MCTVVPKNNPQARIDPENLHAPSEQANADVATQKCPLRRPHPAEAHHARRARAICGRGVGRPVGDRARYAGAVRALPARIVGGEDVYCQGFSEPDPGLPGTAMINLMYRAGFYSIVLA